MACLLASAGCTEKAESENIFDGQMAPLLEGMGDHHFDVSLQDTLARRYFDQAIMLTYGFNHKEAERVKLEFEEAWKHADIDLASSRIL